MGYSLSWVVYTINHVSQWLVWKCGSHQRRIVFLDHHVPQYSPKRLTIIDPADNGFFREFWDLQCPRGSGFHHDTAVDKVLHLSDVFVLVGLFGRVIQYHSIYEHNTLGSHRGHLSHSSSVSPCIDVASISPRISLNISAELTGSAAAFNHQVNGKTLMKGLLTRQPRKRLGSGLGGWEAPWLPGSRQGSGMPLFQQRIPWTFMEFWTNCWTRWNRKMCQVLVKADQQWKNHPCWVKAEEKRAMGAMTFWTKDVRGAEYFLQGHTGGSLFDKLLGSKHQSWNQGLSNPHQTGGKSTI